MTSAGEGRIDNSWATLAIASTVVFMVSLETTIIALAFPEIRAAFPDSSERTLSWVLTAYNIGVASFLLIAGWWADAVGRKKVFLLGLGFFAAGSVAASLAWSGPVLIAARVIQSVGGAIQYPAGLALLLEAIPIERRQSAIGIWGAAGAFAAAAGPSLGGALVESLGWRAIFAVNVPVALSAIVYGARHLDESTGSVGEGKVDMISVPLATIGVGALLLAVVQADTWRVTSAEMLVTIGISVVLLAVFIVRSRTHRAPLLDLELFSIRAYAIGNIGAVAFTVAFFAWLVTLPSFLQDSWGWSILRTGVVIAVAPLLAAVLSPLFGRLADRVGPRPLLVLSGASGSAGSLLHIAFMGEEPSLVAVIVPGLLIGVSAGSGFSMLVAAIMRDIPPARFGMAGAARTTIFQLATAVGFAIGFALTVDGPDGDLDRMQRVWLVGAVLFLAQFLIFRWLYPQEPARPTTSGRIRIGDN